MIASDAPTVPAVFVWPVADPTTPLPQLIAEAREDLRAVARRSGILLADGARVRYSVRPGQDVPGSGGSPFVLVAETRGHRLPARPYHHRRAA